jgi:hypothetical protein
LCFDPGIHRALGVQAIWGPHDRGGAVHRPAGVCAALPTQNRPPHRGSSKRRRGHQTVCHRPCFPGNMSALGCARLATDAPRLPGVARVTMVPSLGGMLIACSLSLLLSLGKQKALQALTVKVLQQAYDAALEGDRVTRGVSRQGWCG